MELKLFVGVVFSLFAPLYALNCFHGPFRHREGISLYAYHESAGTCYEFDYDCAKDPEIDFIKMKPGKNPVSKICTDKEVNEKKSLRLYRATDKTMSCDEIKKQYEKDKRPASGFKCCDTNGCNTPSFKNMLQCYHYPIPESFKGKGSIFVTEKTSDEMGCISGKQLCTSNSSRLCNELGKKEGDNVDIGGLVIDENDITEIRKDFKDVKFCQDNLCNENPNYPIKFEIVKSNGFVTKASLPAIAVALSLYTL